MAELATNNLIKLILGVLVIVVVILGAYFIFKDKIFAFFDTLSSEDIGPKLILGIIKNK